MKPGECATGVDLDKAVADGKVSLEDADKVRAFQRYLQKAPRPAKDGRYTREQLAQWREALVELDEDTGEPQHADVIARIDQLLAEDGDVH